MRSEIIFAGNGLWELRVVFDKIAGVLETQVGYICGQRKKKRKSPIIPDSADRMEVVYIVYDSQKITLQELLKLFFMFHDPTAPNRQGFDKEAQYQSTIYYLKQADKKIISDFIKKIKPFYDKKIIMHVKKAGMFQPVKDYKKHYHRQSHLDKQIEQNKEQFLRHVLSPEQYRVMRKKGTEAPFSGKYIYTDEKGVYRCAACGQKLFKSDSKFQSSCGWPSFDEAYPDSTLIRKDFSHFMIRDEVLCRRCGSHLGHLFNDGTTETAIRYCINSLALKFTKK
ncbi:MAG: peptide-methionine (R)-S-oxide reductase MsrB [Alphaproteobacteria bacterium]|nr:peptide-methionine (R)-S-oxide reductase MsrB [Alphaproteobacteria bacterium]